MKPYLICPTCGSDDVMKNGRNHIFIYISLG
jgi:ssDNA-binding Zn-finger/Zn-ribbon topoisomerase 1